MNGQTVRQKLAAGLQAGPDGVNYGRSQGASLFGRSSECGIDVKE